MKKNLLVGFKVGDGRNVWIQNKSLSAAIHNNEKGTGDFGEVMEIAEELADKLNQEFDYFDLDEIYDAEDKTFYVELRDKVGNLIVEVKE